jgi:Flp pilus assembly protein CpaB
MGATYESTTAASPSPDASLTTATLEVTPRQADLLALADVNTTLRLDLRQPKELTGPIPPDALVLSAPPVQQRGAAPAAGPAAPAQQRAPAPRPTNPVQVITGDQIAGDRSAGGR